MLSQPLSCIPRFASLVLAAALVFQLPACQAQKKEAKLAKQMGQGKEQLYMKKEGCLGTCPSFEVSYFAKGQVIYKGNHHVPLVGTYLFVVNENIPKGLLNEAKKARLNRIKEKYAEAADFPKTSLSLYIDNKLLNFEYWADSPKELRDFSSMVFDQVYKMISEQPPAKVIEKPATPTPADSTKR